jgi:hypothetical protein
VSGGYCGWPCEQKPPMHFTDGVLQQSASAVHLLPICEQPLGGGTQAKPPIPSDWQNPEQHSKP